MTVVGDNLEGLLVDPQNGKVHGSFLTHSLIFLIRFSFGTYSIESIDVFYWFSLAMVLYFSMHLLVDQIL